MPLEPAESNTEFSFRPSKAVTLAAKSSGALIEYRQQLESESETACFAACDGPKGFSFANKRAFKTSGILGSKRKSDGSLRNGIFLSGAAAISVKTAGAKAAVPASNDVLLSHDLRFI